MLESSILNLIKRKSNFSYNSLEKELNLKTEQEKDLLKQTLKDMQINGQVYLNDKNHYIIFPKEYAIGTLEMTRKGQGYINTDKGRIKIDENLLGNAIDKDIVVINGIYTDEYDRLNGKIKQIVARTRNSIVCEFNLSGNGYKLTPQVSNKNLILQLDSKYIKGLVDGDYIKVDVSLNDNCEVCPTFIKKVGHRDDPDIDLYNIAAEYDIDVEFSTEALEQLKQIPTDISSFDLSNRVDLRDKDFVTIDCSTTKDMDDAVYLEGNKLYVSIADVDEVVGYETPLYVEALKRSTSWYPPHKVVPMFPHEVSNGICSLNENQDRLTLTCEMTFDENGKMINYDVYQAVIRSRKKMIYDDVNLILEHDIIPEGYEEYVDSLKEMNILSKKIENIKIQNGFIDFDRPDCDFKIDEEGNIIDIKPVYQHSAEKIIENFMISSNIATILFGYHIYGDMIFRVHGEPDEEHLKEMIEFIENLKLDVPVPKGEVTAKSLQTLLKKMEGKEYAPIISEFILRSMPRARYDTDNIGHFALGNVPYYGHTTSPIRRMVDLITQTLIKKALNGEYLEEPELLHEQLQNIADYASYKERQAKEAEIEANKMKMAEFMSNQIGRCFEGVISHINDTGIYARINDVIEGKINYSDIEGDRFIFDSKNNIIKGKRTNEVYTIGQKILLQVKSASKEDRSINYIMLNGFHKDITNNKQERRRMKNKVLGRRNSY